MRLAVMQVTTSHSELERLQRELEFQAAHDALTGLPNRAQLLRELEGTLARAQRRGELVAVLFIDLDGFKAVNDTHGHIAGDQLLREVGGRIWRSLRSGDVAARLGGDEFVAVLDGVEDAAAALTVAQRLIDAVSQPVALATGARATVGASVGLAFNNDGETDPAAVLHCADLAVYRAKATGRGHVEVYSQLLAEELSEMLSFEDAIRAAVDNDELVVHYQPVIGVRSKRVEGYEALVRWERPDVGLVRPHDFISAAEQSDLICIVDNWVMRRALEQVQQWNLQRGVRDLWVAVNVSGRHVNTSRLCSDVANAFDGLEVDRHQLVVEITETVDVTAFGVDTLQDLRLMGVGLTLDDLGKGYSSIAQLSRLPVSQVKIDRTFIEDVRTPAERQLLRAMVDAAHAMGMTVVGEGVERNDQVLLLEALGVDLAQGYLLGRPMPPVSMATVS
jgi:diguanylate cyclase (GGDEF)-like protein